MRRAFVGAALAAVVAGGRGAVAEGIAITGVNVVDVVAGRVVPARTVLIEGDRIASVQPAAGAAVPRGATVIDGTGLYLMPGLFDAHVHLIASPETFAPMLVANGVTCVRDLGAPTEAILGLRIQSAGDKALLPKIVCTGAIVDGAKPFWPFSHACATPADAVAAVTKLAEAGVDQIKVYSMLEPEVFRAAITEAHRRGLKATGHVPLAVTLEEAMAAGQDCCEHLTGFDQAIAAITGWEPPDDLDTPFKWFAAWSSYPKAAPADLDALAARIAKSGMAICPTIVVMESIGRAADPEKATADPRMDYVSPTMRSFWGGENYEDFGNWANVAWPHMRALVGRLHAAGVRLMVGTDLANPYVFAGFAVHEEMAHFQAAGIPAADVLRAATIGPARFCGLDADQGTVEPGKLASLVLVRGDPLRDVREAAKIEAVFLAGRHFDRASLDGMLEGVRAQVVAEVAAAAPREAPPAPPLPGTIVYRGRYAMKFMNFDAGSEEFVITRDDDGAHHVRADVRPKGGPQPPSTVTFHVGAAPGFEFRAAEWSVAGARPFDAAYRSDGAGAIVVEARRGQESLPGQTFQVPEAPSISGPAYATEFAAHAALRLAVGQEAAASAVSFGWANPPWNLTSSPQVIVRDPDTTYALPGEGAAPIPARQYRATTTTEVGEFKALTLTDEQGLVLKMVVTMPFGTLTVELAELEAE